MASDGGIFAFGMPASTARSPASVSARPARACRPSLNAPIVGMVPSTDGGGYFMVASDGGVFAFGDARFEGSCPGIGGCVGAAVAVVPDATGNGYWVVTNPGAVYTFGDARTYGQPGPQPSAVTSAVATPDGRGYWVLDAAGQVFAYGDAAPLGGLAAGSAGGSTRPRPSSPRPTAAGTGWSTALGKVSRRSAMPPTTATCREAHLNGPIMAASGS